MSPRGWLYLGHGLLSAAALGACAGVVRPATLVTGISRRMHNPLVATARSLGLEVHQTLSVNRDPVVGRLARQSEVAVCCGWSERIASDLLNAPRSGWLNLHPSHLPQWRGGDPLAWQLATKARRLGCSVHVMSQDFDDGPVVAAGTVDALDGERHAAAMVRVGAELGRVLASPLTHVLQGGELNPMAQDEAASSWCPPLGVSIMLHPERLTVRQATGMMLAFSPHPGVLVTGLEGVRVSSPREGGPLGPGDAPGEVYHDGRGRDRRARVRIACRDGWLDARSEP